MPALGTKLHVPPMRRRLVPRPRLTERLRAEPTSMPRLVLVSAPAGFGKWTLLAQWLASRRGDEDSESDGQAPRVAWLSLDAEDSELRRSSLTLSRPSRRAAPGWMRRRWRC